MEAVDSCYEDVGKCHVYLLSEIRCNFLTYYISVESIITFILYSIPQLLHMHNTHIMHRLLYGCIMF